MFSLDDYSSFIDSLNKYVDQAKSKFPGFDPNEFSVEICNSRDLGNLADTDEEEYLVDLFMDEDYYSLLCIRSTYIFDLDDMKKVHEEYKSLVKKINNDWNNELKEKQKQDKIEMIKRLQQEIDNG